MRRKKLIVLVAVWLLCACCVFGQNVKPRVTILSTGGTISSIKGAQGLKPEFSADQLIKKVPALKKFAQLNGKILFNLDSTNMHPEDWLIIAEEIQKISRQDRRLRGIVISHGTDTLAYTASALSFMIQNPRFPIVLTGSQVPISEPHSDAPRNLTNAVQFAAYGPPGVFVVFGGKVIKGVRASKTHTTSTDTFKSVNVPPTAIFGMEDKVQFLSEFMDIQKSGPEKHRFQGRKQMTFDTKIDPLVLDVKITPGYKPAWLLKLCDPEKVHGLVLEGFGVGNVPNREPYNLLPVLKKFREKEIPVVVVSQCPFGSVEMDIYEVGQKAKELGLIPAGSMTKEAAVTKLMWVLGHTKDPDEVRKMFLKDVAGEI